MVEVTISNRDLIFRCLTCQSALNQRAYLRGQHLQWDVGVLHQTKLLSANSPQLLNISQSILIIDTKSMSKFYTSGN